MIKSLSVIFGLLRLLPAVILAATVAIGCSRNKPDQRLTVIEQQIYEDPIEAIDELREIDTAKLGRDDRALYDLLTIKAADKAHRTHTSDSLILCTIDYFKDHGPLGRYSEALYYGGRVYSDLGDYPSALEYFHQALENLPQDSINSDFEANVSAQTAILLGRLRFYQEAIPYIQRCIDIDKIIKDTLNLFKDTKLMAENFMISHNNAAAEPYLKKSAKLSKYLPEKYGALNKIYIASIEAEKDTATDYQVKVLEENLPLVEPISRNTALYHAINIYLDRGMEEKAYSAALEIIADSSRSQKAYAYATLLMPEFAHMLPTDSARKFINEYKDILIARYDENDAMLVTNQQAFYNYRIHQQKRIKAEQDKRRLQWGITLIIILTLLGALFLLLRKYNRNKKALEMSLILDNIKQLKEMIEKNAEKENSREKEEAAATKEMKPATSDMKDRPQEDDSEPESDIFGFAEPMEFELDDSKADLNEQLLIKLRNEFLTLSNSGATKPLSRAIVDSIAYKEFLRHIKEEKPVTDERLWKNIEKLILADSPDFLKKLKLLSRDRLTLSEYQTALLVRLRFNPSQMSILLGRSLNTISSRRGFLSMKLFEQNVGTKIIDRIIRSL